MDKSNQKSIFLTWEWMYTWWKNYSPKLPDEAELCIIVVAGDDDFSKPLAILPAFSIRLGGLLVLKLIGTEFESSDYLDVITRPSERQSIIPFILSHPAVQPILRRTDLIQFDNLLDDSLLLSSARDIAAFLNRPYLSYRTSTCPYLSLPKSEEELLQGLSRNMRSKIRRVNNKIKKSADLSISLARDERSLNGAIGDLFRLHQLRFSDKQKKTKFAFEKRGAFHQNAARLFLKKGWLHFYTIRKNNEMIGALYCYNYKGTLMYMQGGFNPEYAKLNLGNYIIYRAIRDAIDQQLEIFDFMRGAEEYKFRWTSDVRYLHRLIIARSVKGRIYLWRHRTIRSLKAFLKNRILRGIRK